MLFSCAFSVSNKTVWPWGRRRSNNALLMRTGDINIGYIGISSLVVYKSYRYLRYIIKSIPSTYWPQYWGNNFGAFIITSAQNECGCLSSFAGWNIHARHIFLWLFGASHCLSWWLHITNKIMILKGKNVKMYWFQWMKCPVCFCP